MNLKIRSISLFITLLAAFAVNSPAYSADTTRTHDGWTIGAVPSLGYNSDKGIEYGATADFYNFGDGSRYPNYEQMFRLSFGHTTRASQTVTAFMDLPEFGESGLRLTGFIGYETDMLQPFYGMNGYGSPYRPAVEISTPDDPRYDADEYISRLYYTYDRTMWRLTADLQGDLIGNWRWISGIGLLDIEIRQTRTHQFDADLPNRTLYSDLRNVNLIPQEEANGGKARYLKGGFVYDSRDADMAPESGVWSEAFVTHFMNTLGSEETYTIASITHRQYFPVIPEQLTIATRVKYQGNIHGETPFYVLPVLFSSYRIREGLGGSQTIRGVQQNRVVGQSLGLVNLESRYKFYHRQLLDYDITFTLNGFYDTGRVLSSEEDNLHHGVGAGLSVIINRNFITTLDVAKSLHPRDGRGGIYIHSGYLY